MSSFANNSRRLYVVSEHTFLNAFDLKHCSVLGFVLGGVQVLDFGVDFVGIHNDKALFGTVES